MTGGQDEVMEQIAEQNREYRQIESTGHVQTIEQRRGAALKHIAHTLARVGQGLSILDESRAAHYCELAINAIGDPPVPRVTIIKHKPQPKGTETCRF
jgi:hypothetical protein